MWGPSTRNCVFLSRNPMQEAHYGDTVEAAVQKLVTNLKFQCSPQFYDPHLESHKLISVRPKNLSPDGRCCLTSRIATRRISRMIFLASIKVDAAQQITFYKNLSLHQWFASAAGHIFEDFVLAWLSAYPASSPLPCKNKDGLLSFELPVSSREHALYHKPGNTP
jgi:hypothetical protein